jgi:hypothetical protein
LPSDVPGWQGDRPKGYDAVALLRPLTAEQLAHSLALSTGYVKTLEAKYQREKKKRKIEKITFPIVRTLFEREREYRPFEERFANGGSTFQANVSQGTGLRPQGVDRPSAPGRCPTLWNETPSG